jgi:hypothetical protein
MPVLAPLPGCGMKWGVFSQSGGIAALDHRLLIGEPSGFKKE